MQNADSSHPNAWAKLVPLNLPLDSRDLSLTKDSCTVGKAITKNIQIVDSRIDDVHYRIYKETNGTDDDGNAGSDDLYWIENLSCTGIVVEDNVINTRNKHQLESGDKIGFLTLHEMKPEAVLIHVFCPLIRKSNKLKRFRDEYGERLEENKECEKCKSFCDEQKDHLECNICNSLIYNCMTVWPCLHNFCASCISDWMLESQVCPNCKQEVSGLRKNSTLNGLINSLLQMDPKLRKIPEYYNEKDEKERIKPLFEVIMFPDGSLYEGELVNGRKEGKGKIKFLNKDVYEGDWVDNNMEGKGKMIFANKDVYEGEWANNYMEGKGKMVYTSGNVYEGHWRKNKKEGKGKVIYEDGDIYDGHWIGDNIEGKGKMTYINGMIYEGDWIKNRYEGKGKMIYTDRDEYAVYDGNWVNHQKEEKGKMLYTNGDIYEGDWTNNYMEGKGKMMYANGSIYEGDWVEDNRKGKGKMMDTKGNIYEGYWGDDKMNGKGKMIYANGDIYEGDWINNVKEGKGKMIYANGSVYEGDWVNDNKA